MTTALLGALSCHSTSPSWRHMKARLTELQALQSPLRLAQTKSSGSWQWVRPRVMINSSPTYMCVIQHDSLIGCSNTLSNREPFRTVLRILRRLIVRGEWHLSLFSFNRVNVGLGEFVEKRKKKQSFPFAFISKSDLSTGLCVLLTVPQQCYGLWSSCSCWNPSAEPTTARASLHQKITSADSTSGSVPHSRIKSEFLLLWWWIFYSKLWLNQGDPSF